MVNTSNNNQVTSNQFNVFLSKLKSLSEAELNKYIEQARKLGISEENISQGMSAINSLRGKYN